MDISQTACLSILDSNDFGVYYFENREGLLYASRFIIQVLSVEEIMPYDDFLRVLFGLPCTRKGFVIISEPPRWLEVTFSDITKQNGIMRDVTGQVTSQKRMEILRDTDPLTGLYTLDVFIERVTGRFGKAPAAIAHIGLDMQKAVNSRYGYIFGDSMISHVACHFACLSDVGAEICRPAGDELLVYIEGASSEEIIRKLEQKHAGLERTSLNTPSGTNITPRCTTGFCLVPDDADDLQEALHKAALTMHSGKETWRGKFARFDSVQYKKRILLTESFDELDTLIERNLFDYVFQPIVSVKTGRACFFEVLMRPRHPVLSTPLSVLEAAAAQTRLQDIERLTLFNTFNWLDTHPESLKERRFFFNSIPSQTLTDDDFAMLTKRYGHLFEYTVCEITESERGGNQEVIEKAERFASYGAKIAIDDFGEGHSNHQSLLNLPADYLKLDISLVSGIEGIEKKQVMVGGIVEYCRQNGIDVIAEGIETQAEMKFLAGLGIEYLQGFYLGRPQKEPADIDNSLSEVIVDMH